MASSSAAPQAAQEGQSRLASDDDNESYEHSFVSADEENPGDVTGAIGAGALPEVFNASRTQRLSMAMERCCRAFHFPVPKLPQRSRDDASKLDSAVLWLQGNTQYLMQSAIGGWSAAFTRVMHEAVAIRIEPVAVALKEGGRPVQGAVYGVRSSRGALWLSPRHSGAKAQPWRAKLGPVDEVA